MQRSKRLTLICKILFMSFLSMGLTSCGPKVDSSNAASQMAEAVCSKMESCSEGSVFAKDTCQQGLVQSYTMAFKYSDRTSVPEADLKSCLDSIAKHPCSDQIMVEAPEHCSFLKGFRK